jgi:hypothetical protein
VIVIEGRRPTTVRFYFYEGPSDDAPALSPFFRSHLSHSATSDLTLPNQTTIGRFCPLMRVNPVKTDCRHRLRHTIANPLAALTGALAQPFDPKPLRISSMSEDSELVGPLGNGGIKPVGNQGGSRIFSSCCSSSP